MHRIKFFLPLLLLISQLIWAKPPTLTPRDARLKIREISHAHASFANLDAGDLAKRTLRNFLDEIDPSKTYFLMEDIEKYLHPSEEMSKKINEGYKTEDFTVFEEIYSLMGQAIERRERLEKKLATAPLKIGVKVSEFKDIDFAENEESLFDRLLKIRTLQVDAAKELAQESKDQFLQRIEKRRNKRELEFLSPSKKERREHTLSLVLKAYTASLDAHTYYFTPAEASQFMIQMQQRLFGIGAMLRDVLSGFSILRIVEGGPAALNGKLKINDRVIAVNGEPVVGMEITEAVELIRGEEGSIANLTVLRENGEAQEKLDIEITRGEVVLKEARIETAFEPFGRGEIGYIHLHSFYQDPTNSSASDVRAEIEKMKSEHQVQGIILDLRNNAGGLLPQAVEVTGLFIKKGIVVSVKDNAGNVQHLRNIDSHMAWDGPLIVLTNRASASAAEIVAQTLQDYGRALIIGDDRTYGKGSFQTFTLEANHSGKVNQSGEYKVTRGRYYTVSGKSPQLIGVKADIVVPGLFSGSEIGEEFAKYPLSTDEIAPHFQDDLSDIPLLSRAQIKKIYQHDLQPVLKIYTPYIEQLSKNSKLRIEKNGQYQKFLKSISAEEPSPDLYEMSVAHDFQLEETMKIMQDLIFLMNCPETEEDFPLR